MQSRPEASSSVDPGSPDPRQGLLSRAVGRRGVAMLQRIGWLQPSAEEWRLWLVEGAVVLATVLFVGTVMILILR